MRYIKKEAAALLALALIAGCDNPFADSKKSDPAAALRGSWFITAKNPVVEPHHVLMFTKGNRYEIRDSSGVTFETGPMTNVTSSSFECVVEQADQMPHIIGSENYAEYSITGDSLSISFYSGTGKDTLYVTFGAERLPSQ